jgi:hypothetical protein
MKKPMLTIGFLITITLLLSVVKIFASNRISTSGAVLGGIQDKIIFYRNDNLILSEKLYTYSSLTNLYGNAKTLGFVEGKTSYVIANPLPIALKQ